MPLDVEIEGERAGHAAVVEERRDRLRHRRVAKDVAIREAELGREPARERRGPRRLRELLDARVEVGAHVLQALQERVLLPALHALRALHDEAGVEPTLAFLDRIGVHTLDGFDVRDQVVQLVRYHLKPGEYYKSKNPVGDGAFRRLARKVEPDLLYRVAKADSLGRNPEWLPKEKWFDSVAQEWFIEKVKALNVERKAPDPILMGRHLIGLGLTPSPRFREILDAIYELQLDGVVTTLDEAVERAKSMIGG